MLFEGISMITPEEMKRFERGEMSHQQTVTFMQAAINTGLVWNLDDRYRHCAETMIREGHCRPKDSGFQ